MRMTRDTKRSCMNRQYYSKTEDNLAIHHYRLVSFHAREILSDIRESFSTREAQNLTDDKHRDDDINRCRSIDRIERPDHPWKRADNWSDCTDSCCPMPLCKNTVTRDGWLLRLFNGFWNALANSKLETIISTINTASGIVWPMNLMHGCLRKRCNCDNGQWNGCEGRVDSYFDGVFRPDGENVEHRDEGKKKDGENDQEKSNQRIQFEDISNLAVTDLHQFLLTIRMSNELDRRNESGWVRCVTLIDFSSYLIAKYNRAKTT